MNSKTIHVVSFNVPYPPNYGGIIDVFYKVKALHNIGVHVILHCFDYGRGVQTGLNEFCKEVHYYKRKTGLLLAIGKIPYIVNSRSNVELLNTLILDDYPILFEGLHTTYFLNNKQLKNRITCVRSHNIEHHYYQYLAKQEKNKLRKLYFINAARKLKNYEHILSNGDYIAAISPNDYKYLNEQYDNTFWLPPFHPNNEIKIKLGKGTYALYHGNLSVPENIKAALFLVNTFKSSKIKVILAGKNPNKQLLSAAKNSKNIEIIANPSSNEMNKFIEDAQVHLLPTFQPTGIKLKLIASLFAGRHCLVNNKMIEGTGLENLCHKANSEDEFLKNTEKLMSLAFEDQDLLTRKEVLSKRFDNNRNAELLVKTIFD